MNDRQVTVTEDGKTTNYHIDDIKAIHKILREMSQPSPQPKETP